MTENFDIAIIGSGPAGHSAAIRSAQLKAKTALIDNSLIGGTCLNRGCIPTKFLWEVAKTKKKQSKTSSYAITCANSEFNFTTANTLLNKNISALRKGLLSTINSYKIEVIEGIASFKDINTILIENNNGNRTITAKKIIIASGAEPSIPSNINIDQNKLLTSNEILRLDKLPQSLLIIGAGAVGVEFASIFSEFGSAVTLLEIQKQILPSADIDLATEVEKNLLRQGVKILKGTNSFDVNFANFEKILVASGRKPALNKLSLNNALINSTQNYIPIDEFMCTNIKNIYAAGDVTAKAALAHVGSAQGIAAAENALLGAKQTVDYSAIPWAVFSFPQAAWVGQTQNNNQSESVKFPISANSRAFLESERNGFVKIFFDRISQVITGASIVGPNAEELIAVFTIAIKNKMLISSLKRELFFHPSISEAINSSCEVANYGAIELPLCFKKDL